MLVIYKGNNFHRQMNVFTKIREVTGGVLHVIENELGKSLAKVSGKYDILEMMTHRNAFTI